MSSTEITPSDLYKLQNDLATLDGKDSLTYEEGVEANRIRDLVWEAQDKFDGQVFRIPEAKIPSLCDKIDKLVKRANKLGITPPSITDTGEREDQNIGTDKVKEIHTWAYVAVKGTPPVLNGWTFIATLQHENEGTIIRQVPAYRMPEEHREAFTKKLDALAQYRNAKPVCDHCNKIRARKDTYVVVNEDGTFMQVGTNCLADFLGGLSPQQAAKGFEYIFRAVDEASKYEREGFTGIKVDPTYDLAHFLSHVAWTYREHGWTPKSKAEEWRPATASRAAGNMFNQSRNLRDKVTRLPLWEDPTDEDAEVAEATINYIRNEWVNDSDFGHNVTTVLADDEVKYRNFGIAAAAVMVYLRDTEREAEQKREAKKVTNEYVGSIKDRDYFTLTVTKIITRYNTYGEQFITKLVDEDGHRFTWFGTYSLEEGETYVAKWTIKNHEEWKGMKSTVINRPSDLKHLEKVDA